MAITDKKRWTRLLAESAAIIASILIAFAVDSSWAERQERVREGEILQALQSEFAGNRAALADAQTRGERQKATLLRILQTDPGELASMTREEARSLTEIFRISAFEPVEAELSAILESGEFGLIQSAELRRALSNWAKRMRSAEGQLSGYIDQTLRLVEVFERHDGMIGMAAAMYGFQPSSSLASSWASAARDPAFRNAASTALIVRDGYLFGDLAALETAMGRIEELLADAS